MNGAVLVDANLPEVLTVEEVADLLRVDRKTAYAAIAEGGVPGVRRVGRCIACLGTRFCVGCTRASRGPLAGGSREHS